MATTYPDTAWFFGRKDLKRLRQTTLLSYFEMCDFYKIPKYWRGKINNQDHTITFPNGSIIFMFDLKWMPSDPLYLRFGSYNLTGGFIDESNEIRFKAVEILHTRVGRKNNDKYGITPCIIEAFNPDKGHVYSRYYIPSKNGKMPKYRKFVPALVTDNPRISQYYILQLSRATKVTRERLLKGNFEYDDDPSVLFEYEVIMDLFTNKTNNVRYDDTGKEIPPKPIVKYISFDCAGGGIDKMPVGYWENLQLKKIYIVPREVHKDTTKSIKFIKRLIDKHGVRLSNVVGDYDGLGKGIIDGIKCKKFVNVSSPIDRRLKYQRDKDNPAYEPGPTYNHLKSQCAFKLSELAQEGLVGIDRIEDEDIKADIVADFSCIKEKDFEKDDVKKAIISKEDMKEEIGRSPDYFDMIMMRMFFEFDKKVSFVVGST